MVMVMMVTIVMMVTMVMMMVMMMLWTQCSLIILQCQKG